MLKIMISHFCLNANQKILDKKFPHLLIDNKISKINAAFEMGQN